jgi:hypothetical protein
MAGAWHQLWPLAARRANALNGDVKGGPPEGDKSRAVVKSALGFFIMWISQRRFTWGGDFSAA